MESHSQSEPQTAGAGGESQGEKLAAVVFLLTLVCVGVYAGSVYLFVP